MEIDLLNQEYSLNLPQSDEYETLAGLILNHHQSIPEIREEIRIEKLTFTILEASGSRIDHVMMKDWRDSCLVTYSKRWSEVGKKKTQKRVCLVK